MESRGVTQVLALFVFALLLVASKCASTGAVLEDPNGHTTFTFTNIELADGCEWINFQVSITQGSKAVQFPHSIFQGQSSSGTSFHNTAGIDFSAPLKVTVSVIQTAPAMGCDPFHAGDTWEWEGTPVTAEPRRHEVPLSDFEKK